MRAGGNSRGPAAPILRTGTAVLSQGDGGDGAGAGGDPCTLITTLVAGPRPPRRRVDCLGVQRHWGHQHERCRGHDRHCVAAATLHGTFRPVTAVVVSRCVGAGAKCEAGAAGAAVQPGTVGAVLRFKLAPGGTVTLAITVLTSVTTGAAPNRTLSLALAAAANAAADAAAIVARAISFWSAFWARAPRPHCRPRGWRWSAAGTARNAWSAWRAGAGALLRGSGETG